MRVSVCVLLVLSACSACSYRTPYTSQAKVDGSSVSSDNASDSALAKSKFCTEAALNFWNRHSWKDNPYPSQIVDYTSHYNAALNKCLVDVHSVTPGTGAKVVEADHIYDAFEDKVLAGQLLTKKSAYPDADIEGAVLIRDGQFIRGNEAVKSFIPWFKALMLE